MDLNATLFGQMITFAIFVWFTMKFVWPPITKAMEERRQKIADGLAAAEEGKHQLELAQHKAAEQLRDAKINASEIIKQANNRANQIIEDAKQQAREEGARLLDIAQNDIQQEFNSAKDALRRQVASIAVSGAEKILKQRIDEQAHASLLDSLVAELDDDNAN